MLALKRLGADEWLLAIVGSMKRYDDRQGGSSNAGRIQRGGERVAPTAIEVAMAAPPQKHRLSMEQRQALEMVAGSPHGVTEDLLVLAHGFNSDMIAGLVRATLATAQRETVRAGGESVEVVRIRITDAGRQALETGGMLAKPLPSWNIYRVDGKAKWIGSIKAANADAAIEAAAKEFATDGRRLFAVRHRVIA
jgi:hypothetical protein